jgi:FKBP-type peptidyl-prolyl cis-trans isomerase
MLRGLVTLIALGQASLVSGDADWVKKNREFLTENMKAEGVEVTFSGLQYKVITPQFLYNHV